MEPSSALLLQLLIIPAAIVYGVFVGRAKARRLRTLQRDLANGKARGYAVIAIVAIFVVWQMSMTTS